MWSTSRAQFERRLNPLASPEGWRGQGGRTRCPLSLRSERVVSSYERKGRHRDEGPVEDLFAVRGGEVRLRTSGLDLSGAKQLSVW